MHLEIDVSDEADAIALKRRIDLFLKGVDKGDYSGRSVEIKGRKNEN